MAHSALPESRRESIRKYVDSDFSRAVAELESLVRIPSVSWDAFDEAELDRSAAAIADRANSLGLFVSVGRYRAAAPSGEPGKPAVLAHRPARPGYPRVLLYAHHDVQPPGDYALWTSDPFSPSQRGERLYGRGASDDKAGVVAHLAALRAFAEHHPDPGIGLTLFIEGEEEAGSPSFDQFLADHRAQLAADVIVVADSDNHDVTTPSLTVSLRGNLILVIEVRTLGHASHSGMFGGAIPDAVMALARLIDSFYDADGAVAVTGLASFPGPDDGYSETDLAREAALIARPIGLGSVHSRLWNGPAITVTGIDVTPVAQASNTLIPAVTARVSVRIAPGQSAESARQAMQRHLESHAPYGAAVRIVESSAGEAFAVDTAGWAAEAMREAMRVGWGREPVDQGIGGSIPFIASLNREFPGAQILVTGVEDPDTRAHSPNESQHLGVLHKAIFTEAVFLELLEARGVN